MLSPCVSRPPACLPDCAAASTKHWFSTARARKSNCQCARPVAAVKAEGTAKKVQSSVQRKLTEKFGEAQVVADSKAHAPERRLDCDGLASGDEIARFAIAFAPARHAHVEQMQLVVARATVAVRVVNHDCGRDLSLLRADRHAAAYNPQTVPRGARGEKVLNRPDTIVFRRAPSVGGIARHAGEIFGQYGETRARRRGTRDQPLRPTQISANLGARTHLDDGGALHTAPAAASIKPISTSNRIFTRRRR